MGGWGGGGRAGRESQAAMQLYTLPLAARRMRFTHAPSTHPSLPPPLPTPRADEQLALETAAGRLAGGGGPVEFAGCRQTGGCRQRGEERSSMQAGRQRISGDKLLACGQGIACPLAAPPPSPTHQSRAPLRQSSGDRGRAPGARGWARRRRWLHRGRWWWAERWWRGWQLPTALRCFRHLPRLLLLAHTLQSAPLLHGAAAAGWCAPRPFSGAAR